MEPSKFRKIFLIAFLSVVACSLCLYWLRGDYSIVPLFSGDQFTLDGPQGVSCSIPLDSIEQVRLLQGPISCEHLSGGTHYEVEYGECENAEFGRFTIAAVTKHTTYILIYSSDHPPLIFNQETRDATENYYQQMVALLQQEGYLTAAK